MNIKEKITNSQMLLVGLGEELDLYRKIRKSPEYHAACEKVENTAIHSYLLAYFLENRLKENQEIYQNLAKILEHKNYFIVSLCQDGSIWDSELDLNRVVTPCGDLRRLQCEDGKHTELYPVKEIILICWWKWKLLLRERFQSQSFICQYVHNVGSLLHLTMWKRKIMWRMAIFPSGHFIRNGCREH